MEEFEGKIVVVTGAGSGIGKTVAERFLEEGATVIGIIRKAFLSFTEKNSEYPDSCFTEMADVSIAEEVESCVERIISKHKRIDILINSAGILYNGTVVNTTETQWDNTFNCNVKSVFLTCHYAIPHMLDQCGGVIINLASRVGLTAGPNLAAYCASKAAVANLTREMALDFSDKGIRFIAVAPGKVETAMCDIQFPGGQETKERVISEYPQRRFTKPDEVADLILFLASTKASNITGSIIPIDGGRSAY